MINALLGIGTLILFVVAFAALLVLLYVVAIALVDSL